METCAASSRRTDSPCLVAAGCSSAVLRTQCRIHVRGAYARMLHAVTTHEQREQRGCSWKSRRAALSTEPPHLRRRKTAVGSAGPYLLIARRAARSDLTVWLAGDTPPARTERAPTSASSRRHSPRVRACRRTKTSDCRHRLRRRGVSPIGSEDFRYLFSDLHGPRAAATQLQTACIYLTINVCENSYTSMTIPLSN